MTLRRTIKSVVASSVLACACFTPSAQAAIGSSEPSHQVTIHEIVAAFNAGAPQSDEDFQQTAQFDVTQGEIPTGVTGYEYKQRHFVENQSEIASLKQQRDTACTAASLKNHDGWDYKSAAEKLSTFILYDRVLQPYDLKKADCIGKDLKLQRAEKGIATKLTVSPEVLENLQPKRPTQQESSQGSHTKNNETAIAVGVVAAVATIIALLVNAATMLHIKFPGLPG